MAKAKSKIKKIFQGLDVFGQPVQLFFDGATLHKTAFGGIITMIILIIVLLLVTALTIGLFSRKTFTSTMEKDFSVNPVPMDLSQGFMFSIGVQDAAITLSNSLFSFTLTSSTYANNEGVIKQINQIPIPLHPCVESDFPNLTDEFNQYLLQTTLCPNLTGITLQGKYFSPTYTYLKINISSCVNGTTNGVTCASSDFIQSYFKNSQKIRVVFYFTNNVIDLDNYLNPFAFSFIDDLIWLVSPNSNLVTSTNLYLQNNIVNSVDDLVGVGTGWNATTISYQRFREDSVFMPDPTKFNEYLEIFLRADSYDTYITRKYETIPQILSIVGGIWNILYLVLGTIAAQYNKEVFKIDLANVLYDFDTAGSGVSEPGDDNDSDYDYDDDDDENEENNGLVKNNNNVVTERVIDPSKQNQNTVEIELSNSPSKQKKVIKESDNKILSHDEFKNKFNEITTRRRVLKYSGKDLWSTMFSCCSKQKVKKKNLLLHKANTKLAGDIDIRIILKRLKEVDNLKNTIFDQNQLDIFNFAPPELIALENEGTEEQIRNDHLMQQAKFLKVQLRDYCTKQQEYLLRHMAYGVIKARDDTISQNLIEKLDFEIKEVFELLDKIKKLVAPTNAVNSGPEPQPPLKDNELVNKKSLNISEIPLKINSKDSIELPIIPTKQEETIPSAQHQEPSAPNGNHNDHLAGYSPFKDNINSPNEDLKMPFSKEPYMKSQFGARLLQKMQKNEDKKTKYIGEQWSADNDKDKPKKQQLGVGRIGEGGATTRDINLKKTQKYKKLQQSSYQQQKKPKQPKIKILKCTQPTQKRQSMLLIQHIFTYPIFKPNSNI